MNTLIRNPSGRTAGVRLTQALVPVLLVCMLAFMALVEPRFFSRLNIANVLRNFSIGAIVALGQMLVMMVGGFDLAVGAVIALASVVAATVMTLAVGAMPQAALLPIVLGIAAALASGMLVGVVNGLLVTRLRISPFMSTLAMASIVLGAVFYVTKGTPIYGLPDAFGDVLGRSSVGGLPLVLWIALVIGGVAWLVIAQTRTGRHLLAAGGNPHAARSSGVPVAAMTTLAYVASGALAALVGVLLTARIGSGQSALGTSAAIESIAACVIGGVALRGGTGSAWRVVLAALFLAIVANALNLARIDSKWQTAVLGVALLLAVALESRSSGRNSNE